MKTEKTLTKEKMKATSIVMTKNDYRVWLAAASMAGVSRAELLRLALREKAAAILSGRLIDETKMG
jgi:hypothetical protein